jgi:hypothetical protein
MIDLPDTSSLVPQAHMIDLLDMSSPVLSAETERFLEWIPNADMRYRVMRFRSC